MDKCLFSGENADSEEHIIPKWLQRRYNLWNESLVIPNGTSMQYRFAKVPVSKEHNNEFGKIENKVSKGTASEQELYLWALKIHSGLIYKDTTLSLDRANPTSPPVLNIGNFESEIQFFRLLYKHWKNGGETQPDPIGSVYQFKSIIEVDKFDFFHSFSVGNIGFNFNNKFITIFLWDQGDAKLFKVDDNWINHYSKESFLHEEAQEVRLSKQYLIQHIWGCESGYYCLNRRRSFNIIIANNKIVLIPPLNRKEPGRANAKEYEVICRSYGLKLRKFDQDNGHAYSFV